MRIRKIYLALAMFALLSSANADTILIDYNTLSATASFGGTWNSIAEPAGISNLVDSAGNSTNITLRFEGDWFDSAGFGGWSFGDIDWIDTVAASDTFFNNVAGDTVRIIFGGLDPDRLYTIDHLGVRSTSSLIAAANYSIFGSFGDSDPDGEGYNAALDGRDNGAYVTWNAVAPNMDNEIVIEIVGNDFGFASAARITVAPLDVDIDIKPGNRRNVINPRAKGGIWVAVLSDSEFDPLQIKIPTVRFGPDRAKAVRHRVRDVNRDGLADLLLRFRRRATGISCGDTEATLTGTTFGGQPFIGTDSLKTVGCRVEDEDYDDDDSDDVNNYDGDDSDSDSDDD